MQKFRYPLWGDSGGVGGNYGGFKNPIKLVAADLSPAGEYIEANASQDSLQSAVDSPSPIGWERVGVRARLASVHALLRVVPIRFTPKRRRFRESG